MSDAGEQADEWQWADVWIISSVSPHPTGSLVDLIGVADYINHAIVTRDELRRSIGRLRDAGLVVTEADQIHLTGEGARIAHQERGHATTKRLATTRARLESLPVPLGAIDWPLTQQAYDTACREYHRRHSPR